jgi:hypothetical protein
MVAVHLLAVVHGMWGNPGHLAELIRIMKEKAATDTPDGVELRVIAPETNSESSTYDGIDYGGGEYIIHKLSCMLFMLRVERVAKEILEYTQKLADEGDIVERFSLTGYSLGGLISRYVAGYVHREICDNACAHTTNSILKQKGFFETVTPVNFNTIATPHIGLLRYDSWINSLMSTLGPKLLSRTGEQFYCVDKWSTSGRPLIAVMADPGKLNPCITQRLLTCICRACILPGVGLLQTCYRLWQCGS